MQNIADYRDLKAFEIFLMLADRHCIKQSLRRMFVRTIAGVYDRGFAELCELMRNTGGSMANMAMSCRPWFCTMSRSAPVSS